MMNPVIPLIPKKKSTSDYEAIGFYIRTDPDDEESDKIKLFVEPFEVGGVEDIMSLLCAST